MIEPFNVLLLCSPNRCFERAQHSRFCGSETPGKKLEALNKRGVVIDLVFGPVHNRYGTLVFVLTRKGENLFGIGHELFPCASKQLASRKVNLTPHWRRYNETGGLSFYAVEIFAAVHNLNLP